VVVMVVVMVVEVEVVVVVVVVVVVMVVAEVVVTASYRMYSKYRGLFCNTRPDSKCCGMAQTK